MTAVKLATELISFETGDRIKLSPVEALAFRPRQQIAELLFAGEFSVREIISLLIAETGKEVSLEVDSRSKIAQKLLAGDCTVEEILSALVAELVFKADGTQNAPDVEMTYTDGKRELSPEVAERTLKILELRFKANDHLHEGCDWSRVKLALEANPEALWSVHQMEAQGHMPGVYNFDESGFDIGTCSEDPPASGRNCMYDTKATWMVNPSLFNGGAVQMAGAMGIELMSPTQYKLLQQKDTFDICFSSWLKTDEENPTGAYGHRDGFDDEADVDIINNKLYHSESTGWRGSLRVFWT